ncbi:MAG: hypothetical protein H8E37_06585 [Planctomycetes bacterium]|nr:hypothetical protein [Planctomycetota bacterium]
MKLLILAVSIFVFSVYLEATTFADEPPEKNSAIRIKDFLSDDALFPKMLEKPVTLRLSDTALSETLRKLGKQHRVQFSLDQTALTDSGISANEPVSVEASQDPLRLVLDWICTQLDLDWYPDKGTIFVTTAPVQRERRFSHSYDVRPLLNLGLSRSDVIQLIHFTPGKWEDTDQGGRHSLFQGVLTVRESWDAHRHIAAVLSAVLATPKGGHRYAIDHARHTKLLGALSKRVNVKLQDSPLPEFIRALNEAAQTEIHIDRRALDEIGVPQDESASVVLSDVPLEKVVEVAHGSVGLKLLVIDGRLTLSSVDVEPEIQHLVVYDVSGIVNTTAGAKELKDLIRLTTGMDEFRNNLSVMPKAGLLAVYDTDTVQADVRNLLAVHRAATPTHDEKSSTELKLQFYRMDAETALDLLTVIPELIAPESWDRKGGVLIRKVASGRVILPAQNRESQTGNSTIIPQAVLIIRQTPTVHDQVRHLLETLNMAIPIAAPVRPAPKKNPYGGAAIF